MDSVNPGDLVILLGSTTAPTDFAMVRDGRVYEILERNAFVRPIVDDGIREARRVFGTGCAIAIEVYEDPSSIEELQLFVMIRTSADVGDARALLEQFDEEWWLDHISSARGLLAFALEYE